MSDLIGANTFYRNFLNEISNNMAERVVKEPGGPNP